MKSLEELKTLIENVAVIYKEVCQDWDKAVHKKFNQSKFTVNELLSDGEKLLDAFHYRDFLNKEECLKIVEISKLDNVSHVRVKQFNSMIYKIAKYKIKKVNGSTGTIPINKCLNDILGLRVITKENFIFKNVFDFVKLNFPKYKCIDSSKGEYKAIHVYIKESNFNYLWELQLWFENNEKQNHESHKKHKQAYTEWEKMFNQKEGGLK